MTQIELLQYTLTRSRKFNDLIDLYRKNELDLLSNKQKNEKMLGEIALSREFYKKAIDVVYQSSINKIEETVNAALEFIFYDESYRIRFELGDKHGKSLDFVLVDMSEEVPKIIDMRDGVGNGIRTVVSFVLHVFYLISKRMKPFIFIDEGYHGVSELYLDRFFTFIQALCEEKGVILVIISHGENMATYANKFYRVNKGIVKEVIISKGEMSEIDTVE